MVKVEVLGYKCCYRRSHYFIPTCKKVVQAGKLVFNSPLKAVDGGIVRWSVDKRCIPHDALVEEPIALICLFYRIRVTGILNQVWKTGW